MSEKSILELRVNENLVKTVIKDGNRLIPLTDFMKSLYGSAFRRETNSIKPEISEYITTIGSKRYITLMALSPILTKYGDKKLMESIMCQSLLMPKPKKDPVDVLYDGIVGMSNVNNLIKQIDEDVKKCNSTQNDLLHSLENNELSEKEMAKVAAEIKFLRRHRRNLKNRQALLDQQITELKDMGFKGASEAGRAVTNLAKLRAELELAKEHHIYFNRDGSNEAEMRAKIQELSA